MVTFRPMNLATDAADLARLYSCTVAEPITAETARGWWELEEGEIRVTTLALDENCQTIGYWDLDHETWMKPGRFDIMVVVAPEQRGQGLGKQMYADALSAARGRGATCLESNVGEAEIISLKFAVERGFKIEHHIFESTLDLATFNERGFAGLMTRLHSEGFHFFSLAEAGLTDENKHRLYELNYAAAIDNPHDDRIFPDFSTFARNVLAASWFRSDTQIIAAHADRWVGLASITLHPAASRAYNAFTGVLPEFRGRGLAQALKLQTILLAKKEGMRYIRTHNDSKNRSMVAVNRKLGYRPEPGYYRLSCILDSTRDIDATSS